MDFYKEIELYKKALDESNLECSSLLSSKEYCLGKRILLFVKAIKTMDFRVIKRLVKGKQAKLKIRNSFSAKKNLCKIEESVPNYEARIAVYTCITGNYDDVIEPLFSRGNIDFFVFSENASSKESKWLHKNIPSYLSQYDNTMINRYIKLHPHVFFNDYDYSVYVDGNVKIVNDITTLLSQTNCKSGVAMYNHCQRDCLYDEALMCLLSGKGCNSQIKKQIQLYRQNKFPVHWGLKEATVIFTDLRNNISKTILENWWHELNKSKSKRDQLSFPYSLWKNGFDMRDVGTLGDDIYHDVFFRVYPH